MDFPPNQQVQISNPLFFGISGSCSITTPDAVDTLTGQIVKGSGSINGKTITGTMSLDIKNGKIS
jgi:hypothetical protein